MKNKKGKQKKKLHFCNAWWFLITVNRVKYDRQMLHNNKIEREFNNNTICHPHNPYQEAAFYSQQD